MMENDDKRIKDFLLAGKQEIEDNGFSRRVLRHLPQRAKQLSDMLNVACTLICCTLFYMFNGVEITWRIISDIVTSQTYYLINDANFQSLLLATAVLILIGLQRVCSLKW